MGAAFLWAPGHLGPTLQGLDQVFFLICHNQAMLRGGKTGAQIRCWFLGPLGPYLFMISFLLPYWVRLLLLF